MNNTSSLQEMKQVDRSYVSFDVRTKLVELSNPPGSGKVNVATFHQMTLSSKVKDIGEKSTDTENLSKETEKLEIEIFTSSVMEPGTKNTAEKSINTSFAIERLEFENIIDSDMQNVGKGQEKRSDCVESAQCDHMLESEIQPRLQDCSSEARSMQRGEHIAQAKDFKENEEHDTAIEPASLLGLSEGLELQNMDFISSISKLESLPIASMLSHSRSSLKRVLKYSKSESSLEIKCSEEKSNKSVGFANISIRNYSMTLGDHPDCSYGPPICLSWDYEDSALTSLDDYEENRPERRTLRQMLMNYYHRKHILTKFAGFGKAEFEYAEKKKDKVNRQRNVTKTLLPIMIIETAVESMNRKCKRSFRKIDTI